MKIAALSIFIIACAFLVFSCNESKPANTAVVVNANGNGAPTAANTGSAATPDQLEAARALYKKNCANCPDKFKNRPDEKLIEYITDGVPDEGMPSFKDKLKEDEMKQIVLYIRKGLQKM
jgi:mono/diheme cytochrome c family protein